VDAGVYYGDGSYFEDAGTLPDARGDGPEDAEPIDAGYFHGDGSYFADGAHADTGAPYDATIHGGADAAGSADAPSSCNALLACCPSLPGATQSLCKTVAGLDDGANCSAELTQLESGGDCTGVTVLATNVQVSPSRMASDGTTLFWTTSQGAPGLLAMPVGGGPIKIVLDGPVTNNSAAGFLAVDAVNLYVMQDDSLIRIPKSGHPASRITESGALVYAATTLGTTAYWVESDGDFFGGDDAGVGVNVKSAPLAGGNASLLARMDDAYVDGPPQFLGATTTTVFVSCGGEAMGLIKFPSGTGVYAGDPTPLSTVTNCASLTSDTNAVYCQQGGSAPNLRIASDGTSTTLGQADGASYILADDTYVYWADTTTVGTIKKAPKAGGGTATILARDTSPGALAVDATWVYWADQAGKIERVAK
jgi:hypothetical protein